MHRFISYLYGTKAADMFNFRLQVFYSVALHGSFTKAARELHVTQPAITNNIKELESSLGVSLFDRNHGGISLTRAGRIVLEYTEHAIREYRNMEFEISSLKNSFSGTLRIGASTTIEQYVLPEMLSKFTKQYPEVEIFVFNNNTMNVEKDVLSRKIDVGIVEGTPGQVEFRYAPFMKDEIVAVAHVSQPASRNPQVSLRQLVETPLVLREIGSGTLDVIVGALHAHGIKLKDLNVKMHLGSTESIKSFLKNSNCVGLVSVHAISKEIARGEFQVIDIDGLDITRTFHFILPQGEQNGMADMFIDFCRKHTG